MVIETLKRSIMSTSTNTVKVVREQSGKVDYKRERLAGNR